MFTCVLLLTSGGLGWFASAGAYFTIALPHPGSASAVSRLVAASTSVSTVPKSVIPDVQDVTLDTNSATKYRGLSDGCLTEVARCTFGDKSSSRLVVLFGDSHAWMWIAAIAPEMSTLHLKLQVLWSPGCPAATVSITPEIPGDITCPTWRSAAIALINQEKPRAVIVSERTTDVVASDGVTVLSAADWSTGLETTLSELRHTGRSLVVIGDVPAYEPEFFPASCLTQYPTSLQTHCQTTVARTSATWQSHGTAEHTAATASGATFINPIPWLCHDNACSIVIGKYVVYSAWIHITVTYAAYLSGVMGVHLKRAM
jgi:hypothetical protein